MSPGIGSGDEPNRGIADARERPELRGTASRSTFSQRLERLIENHQLRRIRLHGSRHTQATLALKGGAPVEVISGRLGHEAPAFTLNQYAP
jgi:integrase